MACILSFVERIQLKILHDIDREVCPSYRHKIWKWYDESHLSALTE